MSIDWKTALVVAVVALASLSFWGLLCYRIGVRHGLEEPVFRQVRSIVDDEKPTGPRIHAADFRRAADDEAQRTTGPKLPSERD